MSVPVEFCGSIAADAAGARDMRGGHREWQPGTKHTEAQLHFGDYPTRHECDTSGYTTSAWQKEARHPFDTALRAHGEGTRGSNSFSLSVVNGSMGRSEAPAQGCLNHNVMVCSKKGAGSCTLSNAFDLA